MTRETRQEVTETREAEPASIAGIWKCPECGCQVQVLVVPDRPPRRSFVCLCGAEMAPGEEH